MDDVATMTEPFQSEDMTVVSALSKVFITCKNHNMLALGSAEVIKTLYRVSSTDASSGLKLVVMAKDLLPEFQSIIVEKCKEQDIAIIYIDDRKQLAEITPIKRIKNMGVIGIKEFVCESREKGFIFSALKN